MRGPSLEGVDQFCLMPTLAQDNAPAAPKSDTEAYVKILEREARFMISAWWTGDPVWRAEVEPNACKVNRRRFFCTTQPATISARRGSRLMHRVLLSMSSVTMDIAVTRSKG